MKKKCTKCLKKKKLKKFYGHTPYCKKCDNLRRLKLSRTKLGLVDRIFASQKASSKQRGHGLPEYSKEELRFWLLSQDIFEKLYRCWVDSDYDKNLRPSVDRLDESIGYSMSNIQLMTWYDNYKKEYTRRARIVQQLDDDLNVLVEYSSMGVASDITGISNISACCNNRREYAGGFKWRYKTQ